MNFRNLLLALVATVMTAHAHPGHDIMAHGASHVATSPFHLLVLAMVGLVSMGIAQLVRNVAARRMLRTAGATALIAATAIWSLGY